MTEQGRLAATIWSDRDFARTCVVIGRPELATDPRFGSNSARLSHRAELHAELFI